MDVSGLSVRYSPTRPPRSYDGVIVVVDARRRSFCSYIEEVYTRIVSSARPLGIVFVTDHRVRCVISPEPLPPRVDEPWVPAAAAPRGYGLLELPRYVSINARAERGRSYAYSFISEPGGGAKVYFSAHYDHWLQGAHDNSSGVAAALIAYGKARTEGIPAGIALLAAEEYGEDIYTSLYWGGGARRFVETVTRIGFKGFFINFDVVSLRPLQVRGSALLNRLAGKTGLLPAGFDDTEFDSQWLRRAGVSGSISGSGVEEIIHTSLDTIDSVDVSAIIHAAYSGVELAKHLQSSGAEDTAMEALRDIYVRVSELPLPFTLRELYRILRSVKRGLLSALTSLYSVEEVLLQPLSLRSGDRVEVCSFLEKSCSEKLVDERYYGVLWDNVVGRGGVAAARVVDRLLSSRLAVLADAAVDELSRYEPGRTPAD
jgi:Iap family predicted aminopeptidase